MKHNMYAFRSNNYYLLYKISLHVRILYCLQAIFILFCKMYLNVHWVVNIFLHKGASKGASHDI